MAWISARQALRPVSSACTVLNALRDPRSLAAREFLAWAGEGFDPNRFDRHAANAALSRISWNRWIAPQKGRRRYPDCAGGLDAGISPLPRSIAVLS